MCVDTCLTKIGICCVDVSGCIMSHLLRDEIHKCFTVYIHLALLGSDYVMCNLFAADFVIDRVFCGLADCCHVCL